MLRRLILMEMTLCCLLPDLCCCWPMDIAVVSSMSATSGSHGRQNRNANLASDSTQNQMTSSTTTANTETDGSASRTGLPAVTSPGLTAPVVTSSDFVVSNPLSDASSSETPTNQHVVTSSLRHASQSSNAAGGLDSSTTDSKTANGTEARVITTGNSSTVLVICLVVSLGSTFVIVLVVVAACCRRFRSRKPKDVIIFTMDEYERDEVEQSLRDVVEQLFVSKRLLDDYLDNGTYLELTASNGQPDSEHIQLYRQALDTIHCLVDATTRCLNASEGRVPRLPPRSYSERTLAVSVEQMVGVLTNLRRHMERLADVVGRLKVDDEVSSDLRRTLTTQLESMSALVGLVNETVLDITRDDPLLKWLKNQSSEISISSSIFYSEMDSINPLFRTLADQLATVHNRLQTVEVAGRWMTTGGEPPPGVCPVIDNQWKAGLLAELGKTATTITDLFSDSEAAATEDDGGDADDSKSDSDTFRWALDDGAAFFDLLGQELDAFRSSVDPVLTSVDAFFDRFAPDDVESSSCAARCLRTLFTDTFKLILIIRPILESRPAGVVLTLSGSSATVYNNLTDDQESRAAESADNDRRSSLPISECASIYDDDDYTVRRNDFINDDPYGLATADASTPAEILYIPLRAEDAAEIIYISSAQGPFQVHMDRKSDSFLEDVLQLYCQTSVETLRQQISVTFIDEDGVDGGGLSREFFHLVFRSLTLGQVQSRSAFHGDRNHLLPSVDHVLTDSKVFWFIGVLVVQAVKRGCRGLPGLCEAVRQFLVAEAKISAKRRCAELISLDDIAECDLKDVLKKVENDADLNEDERSLLDQWLIEASFTRVFQRSTSREAVQRILCYYVFEKRMSQLQSIAEGMSDMDYQKDSYNADQLFPVETKLTVDDLMSGVVYNYISDENENENKITEEHFWQLVQEINAGNADDVSLEDLLQFITGAPYFTSNSPVTVSFQTSDGSPLPSVHACSSELCLPTVHRTYDDFKRAMLTAIKLGGVGFGFA